MSGVNHFSGRWIFFAFLVLLGSMMASCAAGRVFFVGSNDISKQFEAGTLIPDYQYYYGGPDAKPNAIVAIYREYALASPSWHPINPGSAESLKKLVQTIVFVPGVEYKTSPHGARIIAPDGAMIGVWYSVFEYPLIRFTGEKQVYISDPIPRLPADTLIKMRDD